MGARRGLAAWGVVLVLLPLTFDSGAGHYGLTNMMSEYEKSKVRLTTMCGVRTRVQRVAERMPKCHSDDPRCGFRISDQSVHSDRYPRRPSEVRNCRHRPKPVLTETCDWHCQRQSASIDSSLDAVVITTRHL